jgi:hypothetical protein
MEKFRREYSQYETVLDLNDAYNIIHKSNLEQYVDINEKWLLCVSGMAGLRLVKNNEHSI